MYLLMLSKVSLEEESMNMVSTKMRKQYFISMIINLIQFKYIFNLRLMWQQGFIDQTKQYYQCQQNCIKIYNIEAVPLLIKSIFHNSTESSKKFITNGHFLQSTPMSIITRNSIKVFDNIQFNQIKFETSSPILAYRYHANVGHLIEKVPEFSFFTVFKQLPLVRSYLEIEKQKNIKDEPLKVLKFALVTWKDDRNTQFATLYVLYQQNRLFKYTFGTIQRKVINKQQIKDVLDIQQINNLIVIIRRISPRQLHLNISSKYTKSISHSKDIRIIQLLKIQNTNQNSFAVLDFQNNLVYLWENQELQKFTPENLIRQDRNAKYKLFKNNGEVYIESYAIIPYQTRFSKQKIELFQERQNLNLLQYNLRKLFSKTGVFIKHFEELARKIIPRLDINQDPSRHVFQHLIQNSSEKFVQEIFYSSNEINIKELQNYNSYANWIYRKNKDQLRDYLENYIPKKIHLFDQTDQIKNIIKLMNNLLFFQKNLIVALKHQMQKFGDLNTLLQQFLKNSNNIQGIILIGKIIIFDSPDKKNKFEYKKNQQNQIKELFSESIRIKKNLEQKYRLNYLYLNNQFKLCSFIQNIPILCDKINLNSKDVPTFAEFLVLLLDLGLFQTKFFIFYLMDGEQQDIIRLLLGFNKRQLSLYKELTNILIKKSDKQYKSFSLITNLQVELPQYVNIYLCKYAQYNEQPKYALNILYERIDWIKNKQMFIILHMVNLKLDAAFLIIIQAFKGIGISVNYSQTEKFLRLLFSICLNNNALYQLTRIAIDMEPQYKQIFRQQFMKIKDIKYKEINIDQYIK